MKKILFPFDFSQASLNAFSYALHLADKIGATVMTLHVYELATGSYTDYYDLLIKNYNITEWDQLEHFKAHVPELNAIIEEGGFSHIGLTHLMEEGLPADTITAVAEREKIDFIVMGTNGASGIDEIFLGSVTEQVMNDAECGVVAVPAKAKFQPFSKILVLTELEQYHYAELRNVVAIAGLFNAHIDVLQVKKKHEHGEAPIVVKWQKQFEGKDVAFHILTGPTADEIIMDFVEVAKTTLIAITTHHKSLMRRAFMYSLSQQLVFHTRIPLLGLRGKK